jgi:hypothetical protein
MSAIHRSRSVLGAVAAPRFKVFLADECFVFVAFESLEALYGTDDFHDAMNFILKDLTVDQSLVS